MGLGDSLALAFAELARWLESLFQPPRVAFVSPWGIAMTLNPATAQLSQGGLDHIKISEGWRSKAYHGAKDKPGVYTIGYGHKIVSGDGLNPNSVITPSQGEELLRRDTAVAVNAVRKAIKVPVSQNQFDAMVSLAFNIGAGGFAGSEVARLFNIGNITGAHAAFMNWTRAGDDPNALVTRRRREQELFATA